MANIRILMISKSRLKRNAILSVVMLIGIYLLISLYFINRCLPNTIINGVDVSWKAHKDIMKGVERYLHGYELTLMERNQRTELISGQQIGIKCNSQSRINSVLKNQNPLLWFGFLFGSHGYLAEDLITYDQNRLTTSIEALDCLNKDMIEPQNASFRYSDRSYQLVPEVYGTKIDRTVLEQEIRQAILQGVTVLDLEQRNCYIDPEFTVGMANTQVTLEKLNRYVSAEIIYELGSRAEILCGEIIHEWLGTDREFNAIINQNAVIDYVKELAGRYNTSGTTRSFRSSSGKQVEVKGGLYGWIIDQEREVESIIRNVKSGDTVRREPQYLQRALSREEDDIGNTYVEINITRQHLWFYKDGKLMAQGAVVTGNPNRGTPTVIGAYMLNYKQENATLKGVGYEVTVKYFMPFYGSIGLHDASWRYSFGGDIYLRRGTHGCVNAPLYLAKTIFENIEEGTPVICYEE